MKQLSKPLVDFFKDEVRNYSIYSCERAIPSGVDGFKPSQRKVIFGMQKKFPTQEVKVSIASAGIMEISCYHHGSLDGVIVNMAQDFPGSNNVPMLEPIGQFGSRIGPEASAARYIFTKLSSNFKQLFNPVDENILEWNDDDGTKVEPKYYLPLLPTVLVNGAEGMGTGFASYIMAYNPKDLKEWVTKRLQGTKTKTSLIPWYKGFNGDIQRIAGQVIVFGNIEVTSSSSLRITELPIGSYTSKYREHLNKLEDEGVIKGYTDESDDEKTEFNIRCSREFTSTPIPELLAKFKLITKSTENITVWDENQKIRKFETAVDLLEWFTAFRLTKYTERKEFLLENLTAEIDALNSKIRFIKLYIKRSKVWSQLSNTEVHAEVKAEGFDVAVLNTRISSLTGEEIEALESLVTKKTDEVKKLTAMSASELYLEDLVGLKV